MKVKSNTIFTYENLHRAYLECRQNKRKTINALEFEYDLERNLFLLLGELKERTYKPRSSICFVVTKPAVREIFAADFRDRVVHHLFVAQLQQAAEKIFCFDSFACRKGKGTHQAVKRIENFILKVTKNYKQKAYFLQLDLASFFMTIDQSILYSLVRKLLGTAKDLSMKEEMLWLDKILVFEKPARNFRHKGDKALYRLLPQNKSLFGVAKGKGLPIGNHTSQFFANLYLNEVDQFIKRNLKAKFYVRYVDDFVILSRDKERLKENMAQIDKFLKERLMLRLNLKKTRLQSLDKGIEFLGYFIKPEHILIKRSVVGRCRGKITSFKECVTTQNDKKKAEATLASYLGHFKHGNAYFLPKGLKANLMS